MVFAADRGTLFDMLKSPPLRVLTLASVCCLVLACAQAQTSPIASSSPDANPQLATRGAENANPTSVPEAEKYILREFGPGFKLAKNQPILRGDLDGDGREDVIFIATGTSPLVSAGAFGYTVLDPYDGFWAFSDPALNAHIAQVEPGPHYFVLVAHDWQGEKAKAKYVFMNLPFKQLSLTPTALGSHSLFKHNNKDKKIVAAIAVVESDGTQGAVFWNGKTYKFVELGDGDE